MFYLQAWHSSLVASNLWGKEAQLALYVLVDVVLLTGEAAHPAAKLWFDSLVHAHLLCSAQQAEGGEREWMSSRVKPVCRGRTAAVWQIGTLHNKDTRSCLGVLLLKRCCDEEGVRLGVFMLPNLNADLWDPDTNLIQKPQQSVVVYCVWRKER